MGNASTSTDVPKFLEIDNAFYTQSDKLKLELTKEEARHLLDCLARTSAKGKDLDISEMIEDKLFKFLNDGNF
jgi:hypothetical protein